MGATITGGTPSLEEAVVELARGDVLTCSATVIAPQAVLTAAHCVKSADLPDVVDGNGVHHTAVAKFAHPGFDATTLDHDLALIVVDPPLAIAPLPYTTALDAAVGDMFEVIGYGWTVAGDTSVPARRTGTSQLTAIDPLQLHSVAAPNQTCEGDSGGPAVLAGQIIGVASSGDPMCVQFAQHTRVDAHADFIAATLAATAAGGAQPGDRCWYAANCAAGTCTAALDDPRLAFCDVLRRRLRIGTRVYRRPVPPSRTEPGRDRRGLRERGGLHRCAVRRAERWQHDHVHHALLQRPARVHVPDWDHVQRGRRWRGSVLRDTAERWLLVDPR